MTHCSQRIMASISFEFTFESNNPGILRLYPIPPMKKHPF